MISGLAQKTSDYGRRKKRKKKKKLSFKDKIRASSVVKTHCDFLTIKELGKKNAEKKDHCPIFSRSAAC